MAKIDSLASQGDIRPIVRDAAHEVRFLGNDMAHGDFIDAIVQEEADEILELMSIFLDEVFQTPTRITNVRNARQAKKAAPSN